MRRSAANSTRYPDCRKHVAKSVSEKVVSPTKARNMLNFSTTEGAMVGEPDSNKHTLHTANATNEWNCGVVDTHSLYIIQSTVCNPLPAVDPWRVASCGRREEFPSDQRFDRKRGLPEALRVRTSNTSPTSKVRSLSTSQCCIRKWRAFRGDDGKLKTSNKCWRTSSFKVD